MSLPLPVSMMHTLGFDTIEHAPAVMKDFRQGLKAKSDVRETIRQLIQDINPMSLDQFQADVLAKRIEYERSDTILADMSAEWTPTFLNDC